MQDFDHGAKRRRFAVRQTLGLAHRHTRRLRPTSELVGEPRLSHPGFADERYRLPAPLSRAREAILEEAELAFPPDERRQATLEERVEAALPPALARHGVDAHRMIDALESDLAAVFGDEGAPDEASRRLAHQHGSGITDLLEASR